MKAMALVIVLLHGQHAQLTQGIMIHARARRQHAIIIKGGGNGIAMHALLPLPQGIGGHERPRARMFLIPAMARHLARLQLSHFVPRRQGVALFRRAVRVIAHGVRHVFPQAIGVVEQHQGMRRLGMCIRIALGTEKPGDAAALEQSPHEGRVGFIVLHDKFALRIRLRLEEIGKRILEGMRQHRIAAYPLIDQGLDDLDIRQAPEDARIAAFFHDGEGVRQHQLIAGQRAIAVTGAGLRDEAADAAQLPLVGDYIDSGRQGNQTTERQIRMPRDAQHTVFNPATDGLAAGDALRYQRIAGHLGGYAQAQAQGTFATQYRLVTVHGVLLIRTCISSSWRTDNAMGWQGNT